MATKSKKGGKKTALATIGIIGGSGLYSMAGLTDTREVRVRTPFGDPSDAIVLGRLEGSKVAFLARHGEVPGSRKGCLGRRRVGARAGNLPPCQKPLSLPSHLGRFFQPNQALITGTP